MQRSVFGLEGKWEENMVEVGNFSLRLTKTQSPQIREKIQRKMMQRKIVFDLEGRREEKMVGFGNFSLGLPKLNFSKLGRKSRTAPYCFRKNYPSIDVQCLNVIFSCLLCLLFIYLCCLICFSFY